VLSRHGDLSPGALCLGTLCPRPLCPWRLCPWTLCPWTQRETFDPNRIYRQRRPVDHQ